MKQSRNRTKVHVVNDTEFQLYTSGAKGKGLLGIHNAHNESGEELSWDSNKGDFNETSAYVGKMYIKKRLLLFSLGTLMFQGVITQTCLILKI